MKVYEAVAQAVVDEGVETVFGLMGDGNMELLLELAGKHDVDVYKVRHEQGAVAMADGYARAGGGVGVATTTCGPGLLNTSTSVAVARAQGSAVVILAGDTPSGDPGHLQNIDQERFGAAVGATCMTVDDPARAAGVVAAAFAAARAGDGPVLINLPMDVQAQEAGEPTPAPPALAPVPASAVPDSAVLDEAVAVLHAAERPVVVVGRGAVAAGAEGEIIRLVESLGAPFATTLQASGLGGSHPLSLGNAGLAGSPGALELMEGADCVLAIGASLHRLTTAFGRVTDATRVIRIDSDPNAGEEGDLILLGDARAVTLALRARLSRGGDSTAIEERVAAAGYPFTPEHGTGTVDPRSAFVALDRALPEDDRTLVVDAGHFISFVGPLVRVNDATEWIFPTDIGCIGQSLAASLGAAVARPGRRITVVAGDGGFLMGIAELETAARYGLPVTFFVINDDAWGQEAHVLRLKGQPEDLARAATPDLARVAEAYGASGFRVAGPEDLDRLEQVLQKATGPLVVDVRVNPAVPNWVIEAFGLVGHNINETAVA